MKNKLLTVLIILFFLLATVNEVFAQDKCPACHGTGKITVREPCPSCQASSVVNPDIVKKRTLAGASSTNPRTASTVTGIFHNGEIFGVYGIVTAQVRTQTDTFTNTSREYFPPQSDVTISLTVEGAKYEQYWAYSIDLTEVENVNCDECGGTGYLSTTVTCSTCDGTGVTSGFAIGAFNIEGAGSAIIGIVVVGVIIVVVFMFLKRRRVSEENLRRLSSFEFQDWVAKRLAANRSSERDSYSGIDALTVEGYPIQIRQEDDVGKRAIDSFAAAIARSKARNGTIVAFGFGNDAFEGVMKARLNYRLEIKTVTVKELLLSRDRTF